MTKLRDPGPYPENIIDEEEEFRPRPEPVEISRADVESMFEAVTGMPAGQALMGKKAYAQLVSARNKSVGAHGCGTCGYDAQVHNDRGAYYGEKMRLR